jgi:hypothetical protein
MKQNIRLVQKLTKFSSPAREKDSLNIQSPESPVLFVVLNREKVLFYDTSDQPELRHEGLELADAYFKRSYLKEAVPERYRAKVFPLGFNYELYTGHLDRYEIARFLGRREVLRTFPIELLRRLAELLALSYLPTAANSFSSPQMDQEPRVLFMARAWDPDNEPPGLSTKEKDERRSINETRARCISVLRSELGGRFSGGFLQTRYAMANYKELVLPSELMSSKRAYMSLLRNYPICVATAGLYGSIGWKMGEYVAFSKAIVSEKWNYAVPGEFQPEQNYLEFDTPEECLHQTLRLMQNKSLRNHMMELNWQYYRAHLAPDKLVWNSLAIASQC